LSRRRRRRRRRKRFFLDQRGDEINKRERKSEERERELFIFPTFFPSTTSV